MSDVIIDEFSAEIWGGSPPPGRPAPLAFPLEEGDALPDTLSLESGYASCRNWAWRNKDPWAMGPHQRISVGNGLRAFVAFADGSLSLYPLRLNKSSLALFAVVQEWIKEPCDTDSLMEELRRNPAWQELQARIVYVLTLDNERPAAPSPIRGGRNVPAEWLDPQYLYRWQEILSGMNLPYTPGTVQFFTDEVLRAIPQESRTRWGLQDPSGFRPTRGILVESLCIGPCQDETPVSLPDFLHGDVITKTVAVGHWSGGPDVWRRVGVAAARHREWWLRQPAAQGIAGDLRRHNGRRGAGVLNSPVLDQFAREARESDVLNDVQGTRPGPDLHAFWNRLFVAISGGPDNRLTPQEQTRVRDALRKRVRYEER